MPAQSKQQQKFMGMVHALQKGDMKPSDASASLKKVAQSMKKSDAKDFASTKHKGLPRKVKQEILNRLKEYANKMGTDHLGGDDYTSSKKGGLRDFDGYDNVDYNKDMPMDEAHYTAVANLGTKKSKENLDSFDELQKFMDKMKKRKAISVQVTKINNGKKQTIDYDWDGRNWVSKNKKGVQESNLKGQLAGDSVQDIIKSIGSRFVSGEIKNTKRDGKTYIKLKDEKFGSGVVKILKSRFGIDAKIDYYGGKGKIASSPSVSFWSDTILEGPRPQNWMQGRTSDYHTKLRGKEREYDDTNFEKDNSGQPDLEETFDKVEHLKLLNLALRTMPGSQKQKEIIRKLNKVRKAGGMRPLKEKSIVEYGQRLDLSYLEDEEARLDGTPKPKDAIDRNIDEGTMIRRAADLAQELLPKDTWSRFASDGKKNAEFVKNVIRDLARSLNQFYKNHNINVRIHK